MEIILSFEKDAILIPDEILSILNYPEDVMVMEEDGRMVIIGEGRTKRRIPLMVKTIDRATLSKISQHIPDFDPENKYEVEGYEEDRNEVEGYEAGKNIIVFDLGDAAPIRKNNRKKNVVMIPEMGLEEWYVKEVVKDYIKLRKVCRQMESREGNPPLDNLLVLIETMIPAFAMIFEFDDSGTEYGILLELVCSEAEDDQVENVLLGGWI